LSYLAGRDREIATFIHLLAHNQHKGMPMKIHEYQAKEIFRQYGVATPRGKVAFTPEEAEAAAKELGTAVVVVKAQIHAGGRGKAGGVKIAKGPEAAASAAKQLLGMTLITPQTSKEGQLVRRLFVEQGINIEKEFYLGLVLDREKSRVCVMASREGGVEIEEVAAHRPEAILKEWIDPAVGLQAYQARNLAFGLGLPAGSIGKATKFMQALAKMFIDKDCALVEINPLVLTKEGDVLALDGKMNFDDNALFRHPELTDLRDLDEENPAEIEASKYDLSFIKLDGNVGCLVNGAGLAMSTMDIIKHHGGEPANFLDVGGGANQQKVTAAFKIILRDPAVKGIFVNIFGGIMKCDVIAEGIIAATKELGLTVPLVVRLEGTNVELGKKILAESGLKIIPADSMKDGAQKIVDAVR
jgi:succinyl-CoA synthetase beta subunit